MMEHPFIGNLKEKTMDELQETITGLTSKMIFASRTGRYDMVRQIQLVLGTYQNEFNVRQKEMLDSTFKKHGDKIKIE